MGRVRQSVGKRGSLKWIQKAINQVPPRKLDELILPNLKGARSITWSELSRFCRIWDLSGTP
jgi:hypothetical protein